MSGFEYKIYSSIEDIGEEEWDSVFGDIPENYLFYRTLERSRLPGFVFYYLVARQGEEAVFIVPVFTSDFNLGIAVESSFSSIIAFVRKFIPRFLISKVLFCGSPFGEYGILGVKEGFAPGSEFVLRFLKELEGLAAETGSPIVIFKDFLEEETVFLDKLKKAGFTRVSSFPAVCLNLDFPSFDDYLKSLGRSTRKGLNRKLKQAYGRGDIEVKVVSDISACIERIVSLYESTYRRGATKFEHLSREFFLRASSEMGEHSRFFLYYVNGSLSAFNLCFLYKDLLIDKFIGFDYDISDYYNLYFVSWAYNIRWCIDNSVRLYYPGQTDYEPKIRLGGILVPLYAYFRHRNLFLDLLFKLMALFLKPGNFGPKNGKGKACPQKR
ncbi:MAG: GNAT family N-acetyltransferase [Candidatus Omnitrophica bacterium]|nr:GNAT family N-acetyltransferase [Candidatus Omnitrophota bacterium]MDD5042233.1 GNAT family N-acetyltransferase [Candidatus Omnitrophota bacterium]MDD5500088.1 GNAT family N-acetyltransferase [Candidatus Omnitrophota bacterium]